MMSCELAVPAALRCAGVGHRSRALRLPDSAAELDELQPEVCHLPVTSQSFITQPTSARAGYTTGAKRQTHFLIHF